MDYSQYPVPSFYFRVNCGSNDEVAFSEVSGISSEMETETITEGGENRFVYRLPKTVKYQNLKLKRGILNRNSELSKWCAEVLMGDFTKKITPRLIRVSLLNEEGNELAGWEFHNAYPIKWEVSDLNSMKNEIAVETIELAFSYMTRTFMKYEMKNVKFKGVFKKK